MRFHVVKVKRQTLWSEVTKVLLRLGDTLVSLASMQGTLVAEAASQMWLGCLACRTLVIMSFNDKPPPQNRLVRTEVQSLASPIYISEPSLCHLP